MRKCWVAKRLRSRVCTHLGDDAVEVVVALRNADKASDLAYSIASASDDRNAGRYTFGLADADVGASDGAHMTKQGWRGHGLAASGGGGENIWLDREAAKNLAKSSIAPSVNSDAPPPAGELQYVDRIGPQSFEGSSDGATQGPRWPLILAMSRA